jgi:GNAT superfamily N-acetyltransferase
MDDGSTTVRDAALDDVELLAGFAQNIAFETERKQLDAGLVRRGIRAVFERPGRARYFVAERSGQVVGTLMLTYEWSDWRCADWWWIQSVYVVESARRLGVFRRLYRHVEALAQINADVCGLRLYVEHNNERAQATYCSLGMEGSQYRMFEREFACT